MNDKYFKNSWPHSITYQLRIKQHVSEFHNDIIMLEIKTTASLNKHVINQTENDQKQKEKQNLENYSPFHRPYHHQNPSESIAEKKTGRNNGAEPGKGGEGL